MNKICIDCNVEKPQEEFFFKTEWRRGKVYYKRCRLCENKRVRDKINERKRANG